MNRDRRYDFLLFIGRVPPGCLPDLYIYEAPCCRYRILRSILFLQMGKRGIEPPMFTAWELIYSQPQHRQSLPLPRNARTPHSISLYATALRIQYQISSAPSERKDSNLQSGSRCCFPCTRHFYQLRYVPKPPQDG